MKKSIVFPVLLLTVLILSACNTATQTPVASTDTPVKSDPMILSEGRVEPIQDANLGFNTSGVVKNILVQEGDQVKAGQVLVQLDNLESLQAEETRAKEAYMQAQQDLSLSQTESLKTLADALATYRQAQQKLDDFNVPSEFAGKTPKEAVQDTYTRVEKARKAYEPYFGMKRTNRYVKDLGQDLDDAWADYNQAVKWMTLEANFQNAQVQVDHAQAEFESLSAQSGTSDDTSVALAKFKTAEANLASATANLKNAELKAPFDGTVARLDVKTGESVSPNQVVVILADFSNWLVKTTDLTEIDVVSLQTGQTATVVLDAMPDSTIDAKIVSIADTYSESQGDIVYEVTVQLAETIPGMRWGMTAEVRFPRQ